MTAPRIVWWSRDAAVLLVAVLESVVFLLVAVVVVGALFVGCLCSGHPRRSYERLFWGKGAT